MHSLVKYSDVFCGTDEQVPCANLCALKAMGTTNGLAMFSLKPDFLWHPMPPASKKLEYNEF